MRRLGTAARFAATGRDFSRGASGGEDSADDQTARGWDEKSVVAVEVAKMAENIGVEGVAVHPRTREQGYTGAADWSLIAAVKQAVKFP